MVCRFQKQRRLYSKDYGFGGGCGGYGDDGSMMNVIMNEEIGDYEKMDIDYRKKMVIKETINTKYNVKLVMIIL